MSIFYRRLPGYFVLYTISVALALLYFTSQICVAKKRIYWGRSKKIVILDPGHGGHDIGVRGPNKSLEKNVTLQLSRMVAKKLKENYRVHLTRSDDYTLSNLERTSIANFQKGDLFISIHTGGSFLHKTKGITIYTFIEPAGFSTKEEKPVKSIEDNDTPVKWDYIQYRHLTSSAKLAELMHTHIVQLYKYSSCKIKSAPLLVLRGADMPSILLEIGYLTNPGEEKNLNDKHMLNKLSSAISQGIDDYFLSLKD